MERGKVKEQGYNRKARKGREKEDKGKRGEEEEDNRNGKKERGREKKIRERLVGEVA